MKIKFKKILALSLVLVLLGLGAFLVYVSDYYQADLGVYQGQGQALDDQGIYLVRSKEKTQRALVFYPGAKVDYRAYIPLVDSLAERASLDVFLVEMPFNLAILNPSRAEDLMDRYSYQEWYMAGHSMGGAFAASFASEAKDRVEGLVLLGAYPYKDYPLERTLIIYGSLEESVKEKIPENSNSFEIQGGNHGQVGNYGRQKGDPEAEISRKDQQDQIVTIISSWLKSKNTQ